MPAHVSETDLEFLGKVARLESKGLKITAIARELGLPPGTLNYKLKSLGYKSSLRIIDIRTGTPLSEEIAGVVA